MSMISAKCDKLRDLATRFDGLAPQNSALLRDAADTICELRDDLQRTNAENAKLEKRLAQYGLFSEVVGDPAVEFANLRRELHRVERENEKLRELVVDACGYINHPADASWTHMRRKEARDSLNGRIRQLGIEVQQ